MNALLQRHWKMGKFNSNYTLTVALWSLILKVDAAGCAWMRNLYRKRKQGEVTEFKVRMGWVTEWDVDAGRVEVIKFTACWTRVPQPTLTETCKQVGRRSNRERGGEASGITCWVGPSAFRVTITEPCPNHPRPELDSSLLFHWRLNKASCVRGHPAHAGWRNLRWS